MARKRKNRKSRVNATKGRRGNNRKTATRERKISNPGKRKGKKKGKRLPKADRRLKKDLKNSKSVAESSFDVSDLSRVDASRPQEITNLLGQHESRSDPFSQAYAGRRSGQLQEYVGSLNEARQGYDSRELNALRDSRRGEMERGFQSGRAALSRGQNNYRLGATQRSAQLAELAQGYGRDSATAENDLFVQGAGEKRRANTEYGDTVNTLETNEFDRGQQALKNYSDQLNEARANEFDRSKVNLGQEAADRAGQAGATLGVLGIKESRRNAKKQNKLIREGYQSNERIAGASTAQPAAPGSSYADELNKLAEKYK